MSPHCTHKCATGPEKNGIALRMWKYMTRAYITIVMLS